MTNREKFAQEILDIASEGHVVAKTHGTIRSCEGLYCEDCDFNPNCDKLRKEWMNAECTKPEIDWSKVPVDTKVLVSNDAKEWFKRYYAGKKLKTDDCLAWNCGGTSWSEKDAYAWKHIKLAEDPKPEWIKGEKK